MQEYSNSLISRMYCCLEAYLEFNFILTLNYKLLFHKIQSVNSSDVIIHTYITYLVIFVRKKNRSKKKIQLVKIYKTSESKYKKMQIGITFKINGTLYVGQDQWVQVHGVFISVEWQDIVLLFIRIF